MTYYISLNDFHVTQLSFFLLQVSMTGNLITGQFSISRIIVLYSVVVNVLDEFSIQSIFVTKFLKDLSARNLLNASIFYSIFNDLV